MTDDQHDSTGPSSQRGLAVLCNPARAEFPPDFTLPVDLGGPPLFCSPRPSIGGFGGDHRKTQAEHRTTLQSVGKAPVILVHGHGGSADLGRWAMLELRKNLMIEADYPKELIWAPSYLGRDDIHGGGLDLQFPHAHNVGEIRQFIHGVCEYLAVDVVDIIAHSLGCSLAYASLRGLRSQSDFFMTSWSWDQPKQWHRVGTFVALAGAFRGLKDQHVGEWVPDGPFMRQLRAEELVGGNDETPFGEDGSEHTPGPRPHKIRYFCGIAEGDFCDKRSPDADISTSMLRGAARKVYRYQDANEFDKHERIIKDPDVVRDIRGLLNSVPPVPSVGLSIDTDSGDHGSPLAITFRAGSAEMIVSYVASRVKMEVSQGYLIGHLLETIEGATIDGRGRVVLPTDGMWDVVFNVEGAVETETRTYWVGATERVDIVIDTENSTPFEGGLEVAATAGRGTLYHSLSSVAPSQATMPFRGALRTIVYGEGWTEGDVAPIDRSAAVYFIAIDADGIASETVAKSFVKA